MKMNKEINGTEWDKYGRGDLLGDEDTERG